MITQSCRALEAVCFVLEPNTLHMSAYKWDRSGTCTTPYTWWDLGAAAARPGRPAAVSVAVSVTFLLILDINVGLVLEATGTTNVMAS